MENIKKELKRISKVERKRQNLYFFKTNKGQYSEKDIFIGVSVGDIRKIARNNLFVKLEEIKILLDSEIHEERMCGLLILVEKYSISKDKTQIYDFYLKHLDSVNNWDLVDSTAPKIIGSFLFKKKKDFLYELAASENLWKRRIAIVSTFYFIKRGKFKDSLKISEKLLQDKEDLINKSVGWMLREIWKRNSLLVEKFLRKNYKKLSRTTLRYAIEKMEDKKRKIYLKGTF